MLDNLQALKALLERAKTIAVLGAKDKAGAPVDMVGRYLIAAGYDVVPVHPKRQNVWGLPTYASLADIPHPVDIVDLFRASPYCADHAREALALAHKPQCFWMQSGIHSAEARQLMEDAGVLVVEDRCIKVDHSQMVAS